MAKGILSDLTLRKQALECFKAGKSFHATSSLLGLNRETFVTTEERTLVASNDTTAIGQMFNFIEHLCTILLAIDLLRDMFMSNYLPRTIEKIIPKASERFKVVMLSGMRQVGKSTLLKHLGGERQCVSLDSVNLLLTAQNDPQFFFELIKAPAFIDEIQLAPELFRSLKETVDKSDATGQFWISGSQRLSLMSNVSDKLPGRLMPFDLLPLSLYEREGLGLEQLHYHPGLWNPTSAKLRTRSTDETWQIIWQGAWPQVISDDELQREWFFESLISLYIDKDVKELANVAKTMEFKKFLVALAFLSGQELRYNTLCKLTGATVATIRRWISIAQASGLIYLLPPFDKNIGKQLVKSPKMYLIDTGLIAYLLQIKTPQAFSEHPNAGNYFETFVITEILKSWVHNGRQPNFFFFRESQGMEIDLLIQDGELLHLIEIKKGRHPLTQDAKWLIKFKEMGLKIGNSSIICTTPEPYALAPNLWVHNLWQI